MALLFTLTFTFGVMIGMIIYGAIFNKHNPKKEPEITDVPENLRYQLWEHLYNEHGLTLLEHEVDEIIYHVKKISDGHKTE